MTGYFEFTTLHAFKRAYETLEENTDERIRHAIIESSRGVRRAAYRYCRRRKIPYVSFILPRLVGLKKALRLLHRKKFPITLTLKVTRALNKREKRLLSKAYVPILVEDETGISENLAYYRENKAILYQTQDENRVRDADFMHLSRFGAPLYGCQFSDCLGERLGVDKKGRVFFCPKHREESLVGNLKTKACYFESPVFLAVKEAFEKKQKGCEAVCEHYGICMGACPMEEGCLDFPVSFEAADRFLTDITDHKRDLSGYDYATVHTVLKDICYGEEFS